MSLRILISFQLFLICCLLYCSIHCQNIKDIRKKLATSYYEEAILHTLDSNILDMKHLSKEYIQDDMDNIILYMNHKDSNRTTINNKLPQYNKESIPFLRACVRLNPLNATYLYDLIQVEEYYNITEKLDNRKQKLLNLLTNVTTNNDGTKALSNIKHTIKEIIYEDKHVLNNLNSESYNQPFVIKNILQSCHWNTTLLTTLDQLKNNFNNEIIDFYPQNIIKKSSKKYTESLFNAINFLFIPEGAYLSVDISDPGTYIQWNLDYEVYMNLIMNYTRNNIEVDANSLTNHNKDDFFIPNLILNSYSNPLFFSNKSEFLKEFHLITHWNMLLIGEEHSGMFLHYDVLPVGSWQIQIQGKKQWHICDPSSIVSLKDIEEVYGINISTIDIYHIDYDRYPILKQLECYEIILNPGDIIYYPSYYLHQTLNIELNTISIALSGSVVNNEQLLILFIQNECDNDNKYSSNKKKYGFIFTKELCLYIMNL